MRNLQGTEIDVLLLVSEANATDRESDDTEDDEENSYDCSNFHEVFLSEQKTSGQLVPDLAVTASDAEKGVASKPLMQNRTTITEPVQTPVLYLTPAAESS
jgi:hypothetical protein